MSEEQLDPSATTPSGDLFWTAIFRQPFVYILCVFICRLFSTALIICGIVLLVPKCCNCRKSIAQSHVAVIQQRTRNQTHNVTTSSTDNNTGNTHMQNIYELSAPPITVLDKLQPSSADSRRYIRQSGIKKSVGSLGQRKTFHVDIISEIQFSER